MGAGYDLTTAAWDADHGYDRPRRSVLICTMRRCGSSLLSEAMARAGGLGCPLEYLHAGMRPTFEARWATADLDAYVHALYRHRIDAGGTLGAKLFWPDLTQLCEARDPDEEAYRCNLLAGPRDRAARAYRGVAGLLAELFPSATLVLLWRRDLLRQAVSDVVALQTGRWRQLPGVPTDDLPVPVYDRAAIHATLGRFAYQRAQWRAFLAHQRLPHLEVVYEDLARDYAGTLRPLLRALLGDRWDGQVPPPRLRRQGDARSERLVLRYLQAERAERHGRPAPVATGP
jgi:trehalose 2-sulfotransferase